MDKKVANYRLQIGKKVRQVKLPEYLFMYEHY
jgi:hypothetical protein